MSESPSHPIVFFHDSFSKAKSNSFSSMLIGLLGYILARVDVTNPERLVGFGQ